MILFSLEVQRVGYINFPHSVLGKVVSSKKFLSEIRRNLPKPRKSSSCFLLLSHEKMSDSAERNMNYIPSNLEA